MVLASHRWPPAAKFAAESFEPEVEMKSFCSQQRRLFSLLALAAILACGAADATRGEAASATPWTASTNSKVRLVAGMSGEEAGRSRVSGIQLRMDPGWKTYWRNPGDSGMPPEFDWTGSKNLKSAEVLYPAPRRFDDAGGVAVGYGEDVLFPVKLMPERESCWRPPWRKCRSPRRRASCRK